MERLAGTPWEIAVRLRRRARERLGLPVTVGIACTKHLAKIASAVAKPDGLLLVPRGRELAFLHPLPIERIWGIGPATAVRLHRIGVTTTGELARVSEKDLEAVLGSAAARHLHALANNHDPRPVRRRPRRRSIGSQHAFGLRRATQAEIETDLVAIVDRVTRRLRAARRVGRTIVLRLRFGDYSRATRSHTLRHPTAQTRPILGAARTLLAAAQPLIERRGITLIGLTIANLENDLPFQLCLPFDVDDGELLDAALDEIRHRYGPTAITRGLLLGHRTGPEMPLLPDEEADSPADYARGASTVRESWG
jgi:DNA polymerase-4